MKVLSSQPCSHAVQAPHSSGQSLPTSDTAAMQGFPQPWVLCAMVHWTRSLHVALWPSCLQMLSHGPLVTVVLIVVEVVLVEVDPQSAACSMQAAQPSEHPTLASIWAARQ